MQTSVIPPFFVLHEFRFFTGAVFTAHGGHVIVTCLCLRAQSPGAFLASMIRMQHRRPARGTGDPLTLTSIRSCVGCALLVSLQTLSRPLTASAVSGDMT